MAGEGEQATLRDTVAATFDAVIPDADNPPVVTEVKATPEPTETAEAKEARDRDERGRFTPKTEPAAAPAKQATTPPPSAAPAQAAAAEPAKPLQRPSSWKKEMWPLWEKLATGQALSAQESRQIAEYNLQREADAARGVSTYKQEWDRAKPILDAVAPYLPMYQHHGIDPGVQFARYAEIHKGLAMGNEQQKLGVLMTLARDYNIPVEKMFVQQNGQLFYNPQVQPSAPQPQAQAFDPRNIERTVQSVIWKERAAAEIATMEKDSQRYPHFDAVRNTMSQLVEAGIASMDDLPGAYEAALALPQHRELLAEQQQQQAAQAEEERKAKQAAEVRRARAAAASPRSATPASAPAQARKGLRDTIAEQVDALATGRV
jgi:hypothetical protein